MKYNKFNRIFLSLLIGLSVLVVFSNHLHAQEVVFDNLMEGEWTLRCDINEENFIMCTDQEGNIETLYTNMYPFSMGEMTIEAGEETLPEGSDGGSMMFNGNGNTISCQYGGYGFKYYGSAKGSIDFSMVWILAQLAIDPHALEQKIEKEIVELTKRVKKDALADLNKNLAEVKKSCITQKVNNKSCNPGGPWDIEYTIQGDPYQPVAGSCKNLGKKVTVNQHWKRSMTLEEFNKLKDEGKIIDAASFPNCSDTESLCILWGAANPGCGHDGNCVVKGKIDHKFSCVGTKDYLSASCDIFGTVECANRPGTGWDGDIRFEIAVTAMGVMTCSPPPDENSIFNVYNGGF